MFSFTVVIERSDLNLFFFGGRFTIGNLKDKCPNLCKNKDKRCMDCVEYSMFEKKENEKSNTM